MRRVVADHRSCPRSVRFSSLGRLGGVVCAAALGISLSGCGDGPVADAATLAPDNTPPEASANRRIDASFLIGFESQVEASLARHGVPGAAVAAVEGQRVVHARGFGVRELGRTAPVSGDTLFRVADLTQAMTSTMVATLVDENRLEWDVGAAALGVELAAPAIADSASLRHLLSMTSGLGGGGRRAFGGDDLSLAALYERANGLPATQEVGTYQPQAVLFAAASYRVVETALERTAPELGGDGPRATYHRLMQERVFGPAGMTRTVVGVRLSAVAEDHATPHAPVLGGGLVTVEPEDRGALAPAEGVASTAADLGRFLILHLSGGMAESGKRVASATNLDATRRVVASIDVSTAALWPLADECAVAMGWTVCRYPTSGEGSAETVVGHLGGVDGFTAAMVFVPRLEIGVAVVANLDPLFGGLDFVAEVRDHFLTRVSERLAGRVVEARSSAARGDRLARLADSARPAQPGEAQAALGVYEDGWSLAMTDGDLELRRMLRSYPLQVVGPNSFVVSAGPDIGARVRVNAGPRGVGLVLSDSTGGTVIRVAKLY